MKTDRLAFGDYQTPSSLAKRLVDYLAANGADPDVLVEPTCGKGAFLVAALQKFTRIKKVVAVEIHRPHALEAKANVDRWIRENGNGKRPEVMISHSDVFDFDFKEVARECQSLQVLVIGNPPWVTNANMSGLDTSNLPSRSNFKNHKGIDAITGKGNFDIGESITLMMLEAFENINGHLALLVKDSVIRNVLIDQYRRKFNVAGWEAHPVDSKKEFQASVKASFLTALLNGPPAYQCVVDQSIDSDLCQSQNLESTRDQRPETRNQVFGWVRGKFVSNVANYEPVTELDGICPFEWRQGMKHDCAPVMEIERVNGHFINGMGEKFYLEDDLVHGMIKSSDLKEQVVSHPRRYTIVTQKKVGQDTHYIKETFPNTYTYLHSHRAAFASRKSVIYKMKPDFSLFGIGDYSNKLYKVAISGLYKNVAFSLVLPENRKPMMLDDTCYYLGFDNLTEAVFTWILLNSEPVRTFLQSVTFQDAKRKFTKEVLMRIDLAAAAGLILFEEVSQQIAELSMDGVGRPKRPDWNNYIETLSHR